MPPPRPTCPECAMNMIATSPLRNSKQAFECLRCGHQEVRSLNAAQPRTPDEMMARRFRDKAAEATQLAELAQTETRRLALMQIVQQYERTAEQFEALSPQPQSKKK